MVVSHQLQQRSVSRSLRKTNTYSERASQVTLIQSMSVFVRLVKSSLAWIDPPPRLPGCLSVISCVPVSLCLAWSVSSVFHLFLRPYIVVSLARPFVFDQSGHKSAYPFCLLKHLSFLCLSAEEIPHRKGSLRESATNRESPCTGEGNYAPTIRWVCFSWYLLYRVPTVMEYLWILGNLRLAFLEKLCKIIKY